MSKKKKMSRRERARQQKIKKMLTITGIGMSLIQLMVSIIFMVFLHVVSLVPMVYEVLIGIVLVLMSVLVFITQRWKVPGIMTKILSLVMTIVLITGCVYLNVTKGALEKMSGEDTTTSKVSIYVLKDSTVNELKDLNNKTCGKIEDVNNHTTELMMNEIKKGSSVKLTYKDYSGITDVADALYDKKVDAVLLDEAHVGVISQMEGYEDFENKTRVIFSKEFEMKNDKDDDENVRLNKDIMTVYISGVDVKGKPSVNSRSDVNIIATINFKTHQIFLVNTPRDYYVPLSISKGVRDKLTHAGSYGVNVSVDTLSMLYGINIDYYVRVNFSGFIEIIDKLGGITVNSDYEFDTLHYNTHIVKGENHLNGEQALGFARERYSFGEGDKQRGKNNMIIIEALINKLCSPAILKNYTGILNAVSENIATDMPYSEISDLAKMQLSENPSWDFQTYSVDGYGDSKSTYSSSLRSSVLIPYEDTIATAKALFEKIHNNEVIDAEAVEAETKKNATSAN